MFALFRNLARSLRLKRIGVAIFILRASRVNLHRTGRCFDFIFAQSNSFGLDICLVI